ncbi:MAG TPA: YdeI/OmpD-associated family protein [Candidatus Acidoferrum sp.]|nr:YdeI/OmpD-associated family protein [Candidatus Acidoferrum sp.]
MGIIRYVDVPAEVSREIAAGEVNVAVQGTVEGMALRTTLVPRGRGCHRLAIHGEIRKKLHVDAGAVVEVALERDEEPREPAVPPALAMALRLAPRAQAEFRGMTTALRRQIVRFIMSAKQEATRDRRARMAVRLLMARVERKKKPRRTSR